MAILERLRALSFSLRATIVVVVAVIAVIATLSFDPLAQPTSYHAFADGRTVWGIANFANVASNAGFAVVGLLGLWLLTSGRAATAASGLGARLPYFFFFFGLILVAAGSAYYHFDPDTPSLYWDRLGMTFAFMALYSTFISERIHRVTGLILLPILIFIGSAATTIWMAGELIQAGDLRIYFLVQIVPALTMPLIVLLFSDALGRDRYLVAVLVLYGLALTLEHFDSAVFDALDRIISGHSLKHFVAAGAGYMVLHRMLRGRRPV